MNNRKRLSAKKVMALLCIIVAVSTFGGVFAAVRFGSLGPKDTITIQTDEYAADNVTIYGNGMTFISYSEPVTLNESTDTIQFYVPPGALTDTLTVSGANVAKITTSNENQPIIAAGDTITVYTKDSTYTGKFLSWDTMLFLEVDNSTVMIPDTQITRIVLSEVVQLQGPKILVQVTTDSPPGQYELTVSYLMRGPTWKPTYFVDLNTSSLECWATIENVESWSNFTLTLVSGGPHIVYNGPIYQPIFYGMALQVASTNVVYDFSSTSSDEYHEYTYGSNLSFDNGTTPRLPLFNGTVSLRQEYFWDGGDVQNRYHVNNTLSEPLASGNVEFYRGNAWLGEDSIGYTPVNAESICIVNYADDIKVTSTITKSIIQSNYQDQGTNLTVTNYKSISVQVLIQQDIYGDNLVSSTPNATKVGPTLSWVVNLDADSTTTIYYEWDT